MEQAITAFELIKFIGIVVTITGGIFAISRQIGAFKNKFATKEYVEQELDVVNTKIKSVEKEQTDVKDDVKYIRGRIDKLIDIHMKESG